MSQFVVRNIKQRTALIEQLENMRMPFKGLLQEINPERSIEANAYLWGVVYKYISDYTGHTIDEVHEAYKRKFNVTYWPDPKAITWSLRIQSTTEFDTVSFENYTLMIRADAEIFLGIMIPLPNECFYNQKTPQT